MFRRTALVIINCLFFFSMTFSSPENEYFENMITIKIGRYLKQEFYEVMSDFDGGIYLDISSLLDLTELTEYIALSLDGEEVTLIMKASLFSNNKERIIKRNLKNIKGAMIDGKLYIEKESMSELLPLKGVKWISEKYTLEISPDFDLPIDYRVATERRKSLIENEKKNRKNSQEVDMLMKEDRKIIDLGMLKVRYDTDDMGNYFENGQSREMGDAEIEYSSQFIYGDFNMRHNIYSTKELEDISLKYPYFIKNKIITIGDSYIDGNDILGYDRKIRGVSIGRSGYVVNRSGRDITINGEATKNSTVEIYQNGKIADYQNVEGKNYKFTLEMRSRNDEFQVKIYDRNGLFIESKNINVMAGNGFLTIGEWDYSAFYGKNPNGENRTYDDMKFGVSHGFTNNLTYSFDYYDTKKEEKLYNYLKHRVGYRFSNSFLPLLVNISYYDSIEDESKGYIAELESEILSHKLYYSYEQYGHSLASDEGKDYYHEVEISGGYGRSDYFLRFSDKNYQDQIEENYTAGVSYDITRKSQIDLDLVKTIKKETQKRSSYAGKAGINCNIGNFSYSLGVGYSEQRYSKWKYTGKIRKKLGKDSKHSYNFEVNYSDEDLFSLGIGFEYKFNNFFKMKYDYDSERDDRHKVGSSFEKVINMKRPFAPNNSKDPDNGYLEGVIFIDENGDGKKDADEYPVEGVKVGIGKNKVTTNKNGIFYLSDVSPYKKNKIIYDYSGTTVDPTLKADALKEVEIIPASGKKLEVGLVPVSMIMGSIYLPDVSTQKRSKFFSYARIEVEKDGIYYDNINPEYDGFFVIQDLKPGKYSMKVNYLGSETIIFEKEIIEVIVKSGQVGDFYDGVDFKISEINSEKIRTVFYNLENGEKIVSK